MARSANLPTFPSQFACLSAELNSPLAVCCFRCPATSLTCLLTYRYYYKTEGCQCKPFSATATKSRKDWSGKKIDKIHTEKSRQLELWHSKEVILCLSVFHSKSLEFITCQYPWISLTSYFQTSSKDFLLSVSLPPFSCRPCPEYLHPRALIPLRLGLYKSCTYLFTILVGDLSQ